MRCPSCNKFVSYSEEPSIDIETESIEDTDLTSDIAVYLTCEQCGTQLRQAAATLETSFHDEHTCDPTAEVHAFQGERYTIDDSQSSGCQLDAKTWQADLDFIIHCARCDTTFDYTTSTTIPTSDFEEV
jgi:hypothetical protein